MGSWSDNARRYKLERRRDDPDERPRGNGQRDNPSRKTLLDRLNARRSDLLRAMEWREESKGRRQRGGQGWDWSPDVKWYLKRYALALDACRAAGIDIRA